MAETCLTSLGKALCNNAVMETVRKNPDLSMMMQKIEATGNNDLRKSFFVYVAAGNKEAQMVLSTLLSPEDKALFNQIKGNRLLPEAAADYQVIYESKLVKQLLESGEFKNEESAIKFIKNNRDVIASNFILTHTNIAQWKDPLVNTVGIIKRSGDEMVAFVKANPRYKEGVMQAVNDINNLREKNPKTLEAMKTIKANGKIFKPSLVDQEFDGFINTVIDGYIGNKMGIMDDITFGKKMGDSLYSSLQDHILVKIDELYNQKLREVGVPRVMKKFGIDDKKKALEILTQEKYRTQKANKFFIGGEGFQYYNAQSFFSTNFGRMYAEKTTEHGGRFKELLKNLRERVLSITKNITNDKDLQKIFDTINTAIKKATPEGAEIKQLNYEKMAINNQKKPNTIGTIEGLQERWDRLLQGDYDEKTLAMIKNEIDSTYKPDSEAYKRAADVWYEKVREFYAAQTDIPYIPIKGVTTTEMDMARIKIYENIEPRIEDMKRQGYRNKSIQQMIDNNINQLIEKNPSLFKKTLLTEDDEVALEKMMKSVGEGVNKMYKEPYSFGMLNDTSKVIKKPTATTINEMISIVSNGLIDESKKIVFVDVRYSGFEGIQGTLQPTYSAIGSLNRIAIPMPDNANVVEIGMTKGVSEGETRTMGQILVDRLRIALRDEKDPVYVITNNKQLISYNSIYNPNSNIIFVNPEKHLVNFNMDAKTKTLYIEGQNNNVINSVMDDLKGYSKFFKQAPGDPEAVYKAINEYFIHHGYDNDVVKLMNKKPITEILNMFNSINATYDGISSKAFVKVKELEQFIDNTLIHKDGGQITMDSEFIEMLATRYQTTFMDMDLSIPKNKVAYVKNLIKGSILGENVVRVSNQIKLLKMFMSDIDSLKLLDDYGASIDKITKIDVKNPVIMNTVKDVIYDDLYSKGLPAAFSTFNINIGNMLDWIIKNDIVDKGEGKIERLISKLTTVKQGGKELIEDMLPYSESRYLQSFFEMNEKEMLDRYTKNFQQGTIYIDEVTAKELDGIAKTEFDKASYKQLSDTELKQVLGGSIYDNLTEEGIKVSNNQKKGIALMYLYDRYKAAFESEELTRRLTTWDRSGFKDGFQNIDKKLFNYMIGVPYEKIEEFKVSKQIIEQYFQGGKPTLTKQEFSNTEKFLNFIKDDVIGNYLNRIEARVSVAEHSAELTKRVNKETFNELKFQLTSFLNFLQDYYGGSPSMNKIIQDIRDIKHNIPTIGTATMDNLKIFNKNISNIKQILTDGIANLRKELTNTEIDFYKLINSGETYVPAKGMYEDMEIVVMQKVGLEDLINKLKADLGYSEEFKPTTDIKLKQEALVGALTEYTQKWIDSLPSKNFTPNIVVDQLKYKRAPKYPYRDIDFGYLGEDPLNKKLADALTEYRTNNRGISLPVMGALQTYNIDAVNSALGIFKMTDAANRLFDGLYKNTLSGMMQGWIAGMIEGKIVKGFTIAKQLAALSYNAFYTTALRFFDGNELKTKRQLLLDGRAADYIDDCATKLYGVANIFTNENLLYGLKGMGKDFEEITNKGVMIKRLVANVLGNYTKQVVEQFKKSGDDILKYIDAINNVIKKDFELANILNDNKSKYKVVIDGREYSMTDTIFKTQDDTIYKLTQDGIDKTTKEYEVMQSVDAEEVGLRGFVSDEFPRESYTYQDPLTKVGWIKPSQGVGIDYLDPMTKQWKSSNAINAIITDYDNNLPAYLSKQEIKIGAEGNNYFINTSYLKKYNIKDFVTDPSKYAEAKAIEEINEIPVDKGTIKTTAMFDFDKATEQLKSSLTEGRISLDEFNNELKLLNDAKAGATEELMTIDKMQQETNKYLENVNIRNQVIDDALTPCK